jgi:hypothetical protein
MCRHTSSVLAFWALVLVGALGLSAAGCESSSATSTISSTAELPAIMPSDFGFVASYGPYAKNRIDTFAGTFTKDIISQTKPNPTTTLQLTAEQMASLYEDLRAINILDYPDSLDPSNTGKTGITASTPISYSLQIRAGGIEKAIRWDHGEFARTDQAKSLLDWFERLRAMIEATPEYQRMPPLEGGYA